MDPETKKRIIECLDWMIQSVDQSEDSPELEDAKDLLKRMRGLQ